MSRRSKGQSEFEKAVSLGIARAFLDEDIKHMVNQVAGLYRAEAKKLFTDPSPEVRGARKAIAEFIVRDLQGLEDEPSLWKEKWFHKWTGQWVNIDGSLFDPQRKEWEHYRQKYGPKVSVEDVESAFPYRHIRRELEMAHRTNLETLIEQELKRRGEDYRFEAQIDMYHVDFFLPQRNLIIECDGEYWHGSEDAIDRDLKETFHLREKGYRVARLLFGKEATSEAVKQELDELLDGKKASLQTVLTTPLRKVLKQRLQELRQRYSRARSKFEEDAVAQHIESAQRLLDEDAGTASGSQPS